MMLAAQQWEGAVAAARQLLQRSLLHQEASPQPTPELCYEMLAKVGPGSNKQHTSDGRLGRTCRACTVAGQRRGWEFVKKFHS